MDQDWKRLILPMCGSNRSLNDSLGLHPNDDQDKKAMDIVLSGKTDNPPAGHASAMATLLLQEQGTYLKALCWLLLVDFATLEYLAKALH